MNILDKVLDSAEALAGKYFDSKKPFAPTPATPAPPTPAPRPAWVVPVVVVGVGGFVAWLIFKK